MNKIEPIKPIELDNDQLAIIQNTADQIDDLENKYAGNPDASTDEGYELAKREAKELRAVRLNLENARKAYTAPLFNQKKAIDTLVNTDLTPRIEALEKPRAQAVKAVNDQRKAAEAEAARIEQERQDAIEQAIADVKQLDTVVDLDSVNKNIATIDDLDLQAFSALGATDEQMGEYEKAAETALGNLTSKRKELERQAEQAAELEHQRKVQEAQAEALRKEKEAHEAEVKKQQEAIEAEKRAIQEEKDKAARAAAIRDAEEKAAAKAERERIEAAEKAEADKKAAIEKAAQDERERIEREQREAEKKAEAERVEAERVAALAPDAEKLRTFVEDFRNVKIPSTTTPDGSAARNTMIEIINDALDRCDNVIDVIENKKDAA